MIIDWQHHMSPRKVYEGRGGQGGVVIRDGKVTIHLKKEVYQVEKHLEFMAGAGIDACVISSSPISVDQCRMCNEYYHELGRQYPDKFFYLTPCLPLKEGAFDILDQGINKYGYKGVIISPQNAGEMLDSRRLWPFYEKMSNYNLPIFIHVSGHVLGYDAYDADYNLNIAFTREADIALNTVRLILGGVLTAFPDLTFIISHLGGGISSTLERIERYIDVRGEKFWTDCGGTPPFGAPYRENFRRLFDTLYFDMAGFEGGMNAVKCALTTIEPNRILFGTDYPYNFHTDGKEVARYIRDIRGLDLSRDEINGMLGGNAARILG